MPLTFDKVFPAGISNSSYVTAVNGRNLSINYVEPQVYNEFRISKNRTQLFESSLRAEGFAAIVKHSEYSHYNGR